MATAASHPNIKALNALRGLAAFLVLLTHLSTFTGYRVGPPGNGPLGVMLFFTLSGFLMGLLYLGQPATPRNIGAYAVARFSRIAPPYLIVVLISIVVYTLVDPGFPYAIDSHNALRHLLFSGNVSVFWSIPPEVQFYALFIVLWWSVQRATSGRGAGALIGLLALSAVAISLRESVPGTFVGSKLHYFLMGSLLGWLYPRLRTVALSNLTLTLLQTALLVALALFQASAFGLRSGNYWLDLTPVLICGLAVFAFSHDRTAIERALAARPFQWLGDWSFSIYLLHVPVLYVLQQAGLPQGSALWTTVAVCAALLVTGAFSMAIERPACVATKRSLMALLKRLHRPARPAQLLGPADV
ncbi:MAG TPA: acyltransferase [Rhizobacter sp.]|nr:acyltransferase [Rhizobacter sp.]